MSSISKVHTQTRLEKTFAVLDVVNHATGKFQTIFDMLQPIPKAAVDNVTDVQEINGILETIKPVAPTVAVNVNSAQGVGLSSSHKKSMDMPLNTFDLVLKEVESSLKTFGSSLLRHSEVIAVHREVVASIRHGGISVNNKALKGIHSPSVLSEKIINSMGNIEDYTKRMYEVLALAQPQVSRINNAIGKSVKFPITPENPVSKSLSTAVSKTNYKGSAIKIDPAFTVENNHSKIISLFSSLTNFNQALKSTSVAMKSYSLKVMSYATAVEAMTQGLVNIKNNVHEKLEPVITLNNALGDVRSLGKSDAAVAALEVGAFKHSAAYGVEVIDYIKLGGAIAQRAGNSISDGNQLNEITSIASKFKFATGVDDATVALLTKQMIMQNPELKSSPNLLAERFDKLSFMAQSSGLNPIQLAQALAKKLDISTPINDQLLNMVPANSYFLKSLAGAGEKLGLSLTKPGPSGEVLNNIEILDRLVEKFGDLDNIINNVSVRDEITKAFGNSGSQYIFSLANISSRLEGANGGTLGVTESMAQHRVDPWQRASQRMSHVYTLITKEIEAVLVPVVNSLSDVAGFVTGLLQEFPALTKTLAWLGALFSALGVVVVGVIKKRIFTNLFKFLSGGSLAKGISKGFFSGGEKIPGRNIPNAGGRLVDLWKRTPLSDKLKSQFTNRRLPSLDKQQATASIKHLYENINKGLGQLKNKNALVFNSLQSVWKKIVPSMGVITGGLSAKLGKLNTLIGSQTLASLHKFKLSVSPVIEGISKLSQMLRIGTAMVWSFGLALLANPITWVVLGVLALVAALAALVVWWDDVTAAVINFSEKSMNWLGGIADSVIEKFNIIPVWWNSFKKWLSKLNPFKVLGDGVDWFIEKIKLIPGISLAADKVIKSTPSVKTTPVIDSLYPADSIPYTMRKPAIWGVGANALKVSSTLPAANDQSIALKQSALNQSALKLNDHSISGLNLYTLKQTTIPEIKSENTLVDGTRDVTKNLVSQRERINKAAGLTPYGELPKLQGGMLQNITNAMQSNNKSIHVDKLEVNTKESVDGYQLMDELLMAGG